MTLAGCELAGNPVPRPLETEWLPYRGPVDITETKLASVPAARAKPFVRALVPRLAPGGLHHRDRVVARDGAVTLVMVRPTWGRAVSPRVVRLVTEFDLETGVTVQRSWIVPANRPNWYGLFALPALPVGARTAIAL